MKNKTVLENVSFIMTVLNEEGSIGNFLESLLAQTVLPGEIIIVDGGSRDKTVELIRKFFSSMPWQDFAGFSKEKSTKFALKNDGCMDCKKKEIIMDTGIVLGIRVAAIKLSGASISQGRNAAIENSCGEFICVSDAGCILEKSWLFEITRPHLENPCKVQVTGGLTLPHAENFIQLCLSLCMLPLKSQIKPSSFMPSSRNAGFSRSAWEKAGKYPQNMDFGEDMKFNFNLKDAGYTIIFNENARVYWNLRSNLVAVFRQFFRYAKGDATGGMYPLRHIARVASFLALAAVIAASIVFSPYFLILLALLLALYSYKPYTRINTVINDSKMCPFAKVKKNRPAVKTAAAIFIPFMLFYIDAAKLSGYFYGLFKKRI
ncbi:MAG: glycosyltransferase [Actinobacteria bacterium]|nr:glycosyltransferase [Actinomycetota bacterium]